MDQGRIVLQDEVDALQAPTGRVVVRTPDVERAITVLDGHIAMRDGNRLVVAHPDAAALNERLVAAGIRVP